ncbi:hypothetical protein WA026_000756 [Henosepilachna vigintioctopunctata]|uniref:Uncharacterized protein n=1 Tax=Henosepilachna vigintioctopunctata TaxID=420089 RepID=A0AAW1V1F0_9CUCU
MANTIAILESRINVLESHILGNCTKIEDVTTVTDSLLQAQTMISSALRCRDSITSVLDSMFIINEYLDPMYSEEMIDVECKMSFLMEAYESLKYSYGALGKAFQGFEKMLDSENINKLIENGNVIESASAKNLEIYEMSRDITLNVFQLLRTYNDLMKTIKMLFRQMNLILSNMEMDEQPVINPEE